MKKQQKKQLIKQYENNPLHKMDDQSRRTFIRNVGIILGVFGVPFTIRMEAMEKISKKVFGSSTAFAQNTGGSLFQIQLASRAGDPNNELLEVGATDVNINPNRTINSNPANNMAITRTGANANEPQIVLHERALALAPFADNMMRVSNRSMGGHTSTFRVAVNPTTGRNMFVDAALQNTKSPLSQAPFVLGKAQRANLSSGANSAVNPLYMDNTQQIADLFGTFQINSPNGGQLVSEEMSQTIVSTFISGISGIVQGILGNGSDAAQQFAGGSENVITLFQTNVGDVLGSPFSAQEIQDFGIGTIPVANLYSDSIPLPEFFAFVARAMQLNLTSGISHAYAAPDWHGLDGTVNGNNTRPADAVQYYADSVAAFLTAASSGNYQTLAGTNIIEECAIFRVSEFNRGAINQGTNWTDGGKQDGICLYSPLIKGGSYGDFTNTGIRMKWDPASGQFAQNDGHPDESYYANAAAAGIDVEVPTEYQDFVNFLKRS